MKIEKVIVCGAGAAGANVLLNLLYSHPALSYVIIDFDKVELRNTTAGTQPYTKADIGRPKVQALQRIAHTLVSKKITSLDKKITSVDQIRNIIDDPKTVILIDAFDNAPSRNMFLKLGKQYNVLHIGFSEALTGEAVWDGVFTEMKESKVDMAIDVCELHLARPFIFGLTAIAATVVADFVDNGVKKNVYFDRSPKVIVF